MTHSSKASEEALTEADHIARVNIPVELELGGQLRLRIQGDLVRREGDLGKSST